MSTGHCEIPLISLSNYLLIARKARKGKEVITIIDTLTQLQGVGNKGYEQLIQHFGSEEQALEAVKQFNVNELIQTKLSQQTKIDIIKDIYARKYNYTYANICSTPEAKELFNKTISILRQFASTQYARYILTTFQPVQEIEEIKRRHEIIQGATEKASKLPWEVVKSIKNNLKQFEGNQSNVRLKLNDTCIATEDQDTYNELKDRLPSSTRIILIHNEHDIAELEHYSKARYLDSHESRFTAHIDALEHVDYVSENTPLEIACPELILDYFVQNKDLITAAHAIVTILSEHEIHLLTEEELETLRMTATLIAPLTEQGLANEDNNTASTKSTLSQFDTYLQRINTSIEEEIQHLSISGMELIKAVSQGGGLPPQIEALITKVVKEQENDIAHHLGLKESEVFGLFIRTELPILLDEDFKTALVKKVESNASVSKYRTEKKVAETLRHSVSFCHTLSQKMLDLDCELALGSFTRYFSLTPPQISMQQGYSLLDGKNLFLARAEGPAAITPISYHLGNDKRISVVTGANSGGKTTLLELIAQTHLMARMGLFVPAKEACVPLIDELLYFGKNRGDKTAGAFETLLRQFAGIKKDDGKRRLILADEIEAVTEPGAAAQIIVSLLNYFESDPNMIISLVTHLGTDIAERTNDSVRIDGIEASGLDKDCNLVVNRNPKINFLATSTPELIIEKLAMKEECALFTHINKKMKKA